MIIRMAEYDFAIARDNIYLEKTGIFRMEFPESCVVYLRKTDSISRNSKLNIHFKNGSVVEYSMNVICVQDYSLEETFNRKLLMFLPYYILRYEKDMPSARPRDKEKLEELLRDYNILLKRLEEECADENTSDFTDIYNMIIRVINHVVKSRTIKERITNMGGKVLELPSEKLRREGRELGIKDGIQNTIINMLADNVPNDKIILYTGCDVNLIEELRKSEQ